MNSFFPWKKGRSIRGRMIVTMTLIAIFALTVQGLLWSFLDNRQIESRLTGLKAERYNSHKMRLKARVSTAVRFMENELAKAGPNPARRILFRNNAFAYLRNIRFGNNDMLFSTQFRGGNKYTTLMGAFPLGTNLNKVAPPHVLKIQPRLLAVARQGGGFLEYKFDDQLSKNRRLKISYVSPLLNGDFIIGGGAYAPDINAEIAEKRRELLVELRKKQRYSLFFLIILILCIPFLAHLATLPFQKSIRQFADFFNKAATENFLMSSQDVDISDLKPLVTQANHMIEQRQKTEAKINALAHFDDLTGLANRLTLIEFIQNATEGSQNSPDGKAFAVFFLDLDRFKIINDSLGHYLGDQLLIELAGRLESLVPKGGLAARLGGDEFVVVCPGSSAGINDTATHLAKDLINEFSRPAQVGDNNLYATVSIGISLFPEHAQEYDNLFRFADAAMYTAKNSGRNRFAFFSPGLAKGFSRKLELETAMRSALQKEEFILHYQAIFSAAGHIESLECLIRWRQGDSMVSPADFIPMAEETGFIIPLGDWILDSAVAQVNSWRKAGLDVKVAVNLSPRQFWEEGFAAKIADLLLKYNLPTACLTLEITEGLFLSQAPLVVENLYLLRKLGMKFSIDDFGTGYSSLAYLKHLKADTLKIDRSFVRELPENVDDQKINRAIISLAHNLGMKVIAEGVEKEAGKEFLLAENCDALQGFLLHKPEAAAGILPLLNKHALKIKKGS